jgi:hypothetical protein
LISIYFYVFYRKGQKNFDNVCPAKLAGARR